MEKKIFNTSMIFLVLGLFLGAFYREYTKFVGFTAPTKLVLLHPHLLVLGFIFSMIFLIFIKTYNVKDEKLNRNYNLYTLGVFLTAGTLFARGMFDVLSVELSKGLNAAISGVAGIGHIILSIALYFIFKSFNLALKNS